MIEEQNRQIATELESLKKKYKRCKEFNKLIKKELKQGMARQRFLPQIELK